MKRLTYVLLLALSLTGCTVGLHGPRIGYRPPAVVIEPYVYESRPVYPYGYRPYRHHYHWQHKHKHHW